MTSLQSKLMDVKRSGIRLAPDSDGTLLHDLRYLTIEDT